MDVKVGSGAFMPSHEAAHDLATNLVEVAHGAGLRCSALLTDMNQCLGRTAGNALEVGEALDLLTGRGAEPRLRAVTLALAAELLRLAGEADADARVRRALESGAAAERFARMVQALGGPGDLLERAAHHLPSAPVQRAVQLPQAGVVGAIDARALGLAVVALGGGRRRADDRVDHAVGLAAVKGIGEPVAPDAPFAIVHARDEASAAVAVEQLKAAVTIAESAPAAPPELIVARVPAPDS
jgi:thymidine phosphorylase